MRDASARVVAVVASMWASAAAAVGVTLNPGSYTTELVTLADDESQVSTTRRPTAAPYSITDSVSTGGAAASATYDLGEGGFRVTFDIRNGSNSGPSFSWANLSVHFSVEAPVEYRIDGSYAASGAYGQQTRLSVGLTDFTEFVNGVGIIQVFSSGQFSGQTPDEVFVVGGLGGDQWNELRGSPSGILLPGRLYHFSVIGHLSSYGAVMPPATAAGFGSIVFVPEPETALLLASGLLALAARRRLARSR